MILICARSEMDITTIFGIVIPGPNPGGRAENKPFEVKSEIKNEFILK